MPGFGALEQQECGVTAIAEARSTEVLHLQSIAREDGNPREKDRIIYACAQEATAGAPNKRPCVFL